MKATSQRLIKSADRPLPLSAPPSAPLPRLKVEVPVELVKSKVKPLFWLIAMVVVFGCAIKRATLFLAFFGGFCLCSTPLVLCLTEEEKEKEEEEENKEGKLRHENNP